MDNSYLWYDTEGATEWMSETLRELMNQSLRFHLNENDLRYCVCLSGLKSESWSVNKLTT